MTKSFLAFKAFNNGHSTWVRDPVLLTHYTVGQRVTCPHPDLPFYIATRDAVHEGSVSCGSQSTHVGIIQVFTNDLTPLLPWFSSNEGTPSGGVPRSLGETDSNYPLDKIVKGIAKQRSTRLWAGARRLKVLAIYPKFDTDLKAEALKLSRQMHIPILTDFTIPQTPQY